MSTERAFHLIHSESVRSIMAQCKRYPEYAETLKFCMASCHKFMMFHHLTWRNISMYSPRTVLLFMVKQFGRTCLHLRHLREMLRIVLLAIKCPPPPLKPRKRLAAFLTAEQQVRWKKIMKAYENLPTQEKLSVVEQMLAPQFSPVIFKSFSKVVTEPARK